MILGLDVSSSKIGYSIIDQDKKLLMCEFKKFKSSVSLETRALEFYEILNNINNKYGSNAHHIIESCFKALAFCLKKSLTIDVNNVDIVPSTKGIIDWNYLIMLLLILDYGSGNIKSVYNALKLVIEKCKSNKPEIIDSILNSGKLEEDKEKLLVEIITQLKESFKS